MLDSDEITRVLDEHGYDLGQFIGRGGFAECYTVISRKYKFTFACKVIQIDTKNQTKLESFDNEFNALCQTTHPNIVQIFDKFITDTHVFLVLEYCPNGDLNNFLRKNGPIQEERQMLLALSMMIKALEYLESKKIAHNDIKPGNFLIDQHGRIKLSDFGLTKTLHHEADLSDDFRGSIAFLAPEVVSFKPYNPLKADVWSFGVTAFLLSTGMYPFTGYNFQTLKTVILSGIFTFPRTIPQSIRTIISKCLHINPAARPTFADLRSIIDGYINSRYPRNYEIQDKKVVTSQMVTSNTFNKRMLKPRLLTRPISLNRVKSSVIFLNL